jgi:hypothetical protein
MFAPLALAADVAATLDLSDRMEVRARSLQQSATAAPATGAGTAALGIDLANTANVQLRAQDRRWDYYVTYGAALVLPDVELGVTAQPSQFASMGVGWHERRVRLALREDGTYAIQNSAYLLPTSATPPAAPAQGMMGMPAPTPTPPALTTAPAPKTITLGTSRTVLATNLLLDPRTRANGSLEYSLSGGLDAGSQAVLPFQMGPRVVVDVSHSLARRDTLGVTASAQQADFSASPCPPTTTGTCQPSDRIAQLTAVERHALSRSSGLTFTAGAATAAARLKPQDGYHYTPYPVAEASYSNILSKERDTLTVTARYFPSVDPTTGLVFAAVQLDSSFVRHMTQYLALLFAAGVSQSVPTDQPAAATIVHADVGAEYAADRYRLLTLSMGERMYWQNQNGLGSFVSAFGYIAVTVRARTLHL